MNADTGPLCGFNIGLSGAVPDRTEWSEPALDRAILEFVSNFSALVFKYGGRIIHGTHPTFTPVIVRQANRHTGFRQRKAITLVMSELWVNSYDTETLESYQEVAEILIINKVGHGRPDDAETRNASLSLMRHHLIQQMNTLVAIGGKLHLADGKKPGVLEEFELATRRGMACFLIGGLGGSTADLVKKNERILSGLKNDLSEEENIKLLITTDIASCTGILLDHLIRHPNLAKRRLASLKVDSQACVNYTTFRKRQEIYAKAAATFLEIESAQDPISSFKRILGSIPESAEKREEKAFDAIGQELKLKADLLETNSKRRVIFRNLVKKVIDMFYDKENLNKDLIKLADKYQFPGWAVECLPNLFVVLKKLEDNSKVIWLWHFPVACMGKPGVSWKHQSDLCGGHIIQIIVKPEIDEWLNKIVPAFEVCRTSLPFASERAMKGAAIDTIAAIETAELKKGKKHTAQRLKEARENLLKDTGVGYAINQDLSKITESLTVNTQEKQEATGMKENDQQITKKLTKAKEIYLQDVRSSLTKALKIMSDSLNVDEQREQTLTGRMEILYPLVEELNSRNKFTQAMKDKLPPWAIAEAQSTLVKAKGHSQKFIRP
ncbi:MAG: hypothetical protein U1F76_12805 [Candidatus Competibacteraceae bacterium]